MFPENLKQREEYIFQKVLDGQFEARWIDIVKVIDGHELKIQVMEDALKIDGVRINVSAKLSQKFADLFDASLPTPLVADLMYIEATKKADPAPRGISSSVDSMIKHSEEVSRRLGPGPGLSATVGKHWVLSKSLETSPGRACNYGWHFTGSSYQGITGASASGAAKLGVQLRVIQSPGTAHDAEHSDYSQICQLVSQCCWVDGVEKRFSDLLKDSELANLVSHQGALSIDRQPGTQKTTDIYVMFPEIITISVA